MEQISAVLGINMQVSPFLYPINAIRHSYVYLYPIGSVLVFT